MTLERGAAGIVEWLLDFAYWRWYHMRVLYRRLKWNSIRRRGRGNELRTNVSGLWFHLNPDDWGLSAELAVEGVHEPILTQLWQELVSPGMVVVDVGANIGYFALLAARRVGQTGKVIAVEPAPVTARYLRLNVLANAALNVVVHECALGRSAGYGFLYLFRQANWNSLVPRRDAVASQHVLVETLDELVAREPRVDVIRMDVEGFEGDVIAGMTTTVSRHQPVVVLELHLGRLGTSGAEKALAPLLHAGYGLGWCYPRLWEEVLWERWRTRYRRRAELSVNADVAQVFQKAENYTVCLVPPFHGMLRGRTNGRLE
jgi:FkbM family methyltransferase